MTAAADKEIVGDMATGNTHAPVLENWGRSFGDSGVSGIALVVVLALGRQSLDHVRADPAVRAP